MHHIIASASSGPSGRRGPWLRTLGTGGQRLRGDPEILRKLSRSWSGRTRKSLGGGGFTATFGGTRGLVEPGRFKTLVRELQISPVEMGFGAVAGAAP